MDAYTLHLLGMAVEAAQAFEGITIWTEVWLSDNADVVFVECPSPHGLHQFNSDDSGTLADALAALLRDLGVEVPERPSRERVMDLTSSVVCAFRMEIIDRLRAAYARDRLAVLALLEDS
jgi:hypothetical protein